MLNNTLQFFYHARPTFAFAVFGIPPVVFWPFVSFVILSAIGLTKIIKDELPQKHGIDKLLPFGRLFYAIPMGVFGADHFADAKNVARVVPHWMPLHMFWVCFVGTALIAAALSIILEIRVRLAAALLGCMFLLFVVLLHIPNIVAAHGARLFWAICLRDLAFSGGAFALAAIQSKRTSSGGAPGLVTLSRFFVGIPAIVFGVEHFLHPTFEPGVPLEKITPLWILGHLAWAYFTGAALIACGVCIAVNKKARSAAIYLGIVILILVVFIYIPVTVANPSDIDSGLNSLVDTLALSGTALVLADAIGARTSYS